ncbi:MAG: hypothetical protein JWO53_1182, partial [Chlamydiia bacterium]|nr:hypothetical protein [Chlamydiia bacterium]
MGKALTGVFEEASRITFESVVGSIICASIAPYSAAIAVWAGYTVSVKSLAIATVVSNVMLSVFQHERGEELSDYLSNEALRLIVAIPLTAVIYTPLSGALFT